MVVDQVVHRIINSVLRRSPGLAVEFYSREIASRGRRYGPDSLQAQNARSHHAVALYRHGEKAAAEAELAELIKQLAATGHIDNVHARGARAWYGFVLADLGRDEDAERVWRFLAEVTDQALGPAHTDALDAHQNHAVELYKLGRIDEAEAELASVIEKLTDSAGPDHAATLKARQSRAVLLDALGRITESEREWRALADMLDHFHGKDNQEARATAREKYAVALYKLGRFEEAAQQFSQVVTHRKARLGGDHAATRRATAWHKAALAGNDRRQ